MSTDGIAQTIAAHEDELMTALLATADHSLGTPDAELRQFFTGFIQVLVAAAKEDFGPRDLYISSVIPAIKQSGTMPLSVIVEAMVRVGIGCGISLPKEILPWVGGFVASYTTLLMERWNEA